MTYMDRYPTKSSLFSPKLITYFLGSHLRRKSTIFRERAAIVDNLPQSVTLVLQHQRYAAQHYMAITPIAQHYRQIALLYTQHTLSPASLSLNMFQLVDCWSSTRVLRSKISKSPFFHPLKIVSRALGSLPEFFPPYSFNVWLSTGPILYSQEQLLQSTKLHGHITGMILYIADTYGTTKLTFL